MEISPCCNSVTGHQIATNFCTCHDSTAVVPCTKFCSDHYIRIEMRVKRDFHRIWIAMEKLLVKRGPGGRLNKKDGLTRYGDSHVKDKTAVRTLTWKSPYVDKMVFILRWVPFTPSFHDYLTATRQIEWFSTVPLWLLVRARDARAPSQYKDRLIYVWRFPCWR